MSLLAGNVASVKIGANQVVQVQKWSLSVGPDLQDTASFGDLWEEKSPALRKWSGSFAAQAMTFADDSTGQDALSIAALAGTSVALRLYESAAKYYSGTAFIEMAADAEESSATQTRTYTFTGSGALSYT